MRIEGERPLPFEDYITEAAELARVQGREPLVIIPDHLEKDVPRLLGRQVADEVHAYTTAVNKVLADRGYSDLGVKLELDSGELNGESGVIHTGNTWWNASIARRQSGLAPTQAGVGS